MASGSGISMVFLSEALEQEGRELFCVSVNMSLLPSLLLLLSLFSSHFLWTSSSLDVPAGVTQDFSSTFLLRCVP